MRNALVSGRSLSVVIVGGGVMAAASVASGHDIYPPEWRGMPNTVFAQWERSGDTVNDPLERTAYDIPGGGFPIYDGDPDGPDGPLTEGAEAQLVSFTPFTPSGGIWEFYVPNVVDDLPEKLIQVQFSYDPPATGGPGGSLVEFFNASDNEEDEVDIADPAMTIGPEGIPGTDMFIEVWEGGIFPNPDFEFVRITTSGDLTQVVIDTWSLPAPGAMGVLALAGLAASRRRR